MTSLLRIPSKPNAPISYTFYPAQNGHASNAIPLIVFINGLGLPAASWDPAIEILHSSVEFCPAFLTYDRYGQGKTTARDPLDGTPGKEKGHDFQDVVNNLHEIIMAIATSKLGLKEADVESKKLHLFLVGASIGGPIVRLYAQDHPGVVAGVLILDSNIANANYSDIWPDPDAHGFDPETVISSDCTLEQYKSARTALAAMFDLNVRNPEFLDRSNSPSLLPASDGPKLRGPEETGPLLSVVGHDPLVFADQSFERMGTPRSLTMRLTDR